VVNVLFAVLGFVWLSAPFMYREQLRVGSLSVTVKLRLTVVTLKNALLAGELRMTEGNVVSMVKNTVDEFWLPAESFA